ncbi:MAG TPA: hypothetical protein VMW03_08235 [Candidatus Krumholzibacteriaceae bacterium]|nr:hypothetical protein [Candidatus Krumholzibacteriaceae bacterium]
MGGEGPRDAFTDMQEACGKAPKATLAVTERLAKSGDYVDMLEGFAESLL